MLVCVTPRLLYPQGRGSRYQQGERVGGFQRRAGPSAGNISQILASRHTDWTIPAYIVIPSCQVVLSNICSWSSIIKLVNHPNHVTSHDSTTSVTYWCTSARNRGSIPRRGKKFSRPWGPLSLYPGFFLWQQSGREADHSSPSTAKE